MFFLNIANWNWVGALILHQVGKWHRLQWNDKGYEIILKCHQQIQ